MTVKFTDIEQEGIIQEFWDIIKLKGYKLELNKEMTCCCSKGYRKHANYCVIDNFSYPMNFKQCLFLCLSSIVLL